MPVGIVKRALIRVFIRATVNLFVLHAVRLQKRRASRRLLPVTPLKC